MNRGTAVTRLALALHACTLSLPAQAGAPAAAGPAVELPPVLVEESVSGVPWLYVSAGGTEFLSRCSAATTREFVEAWLGKIQLMRALVPEPLQLRLDATAVCVLYGQDLNQTVSAEIQRELQAAAGRRDDAPRRSGEPKDGSGANIAPNMRLNDSDTHATIVYIDETLFDGSNLNIAAGHVRYMLTGRVPELPVWLTEGIERTYRRADFAIDPITLAPLVWLNQSESDALASDPTRPRALLPANELFASDPLRAAENQHPRRRQTRLAEQELFVRWALVSGDPTREALWKFGARAAEAPVDEEMFEACFGFDFAELRDRLSDYLPKAVDRPARIDPGELAPLPRVEVDRATPNQIARIRGEWERLAIRHVQRRLPQVSEPYIAQARRTLRRAYTAGDRDPRLLATMGLCEIDAGNPAGAREFLEPATASGVKRPRAYYELARLRFAALREGAAEAKSFTFTELAPIFQPLQRAITQMPPLPEVFTLLAEAWSRCATSPNRTEFEELETGARLFPRRPTVAYPTALALARHGRKTAAVAVLDACAGHATDENTLAEIARLRAELAPALSKPPVAAPTNPD